MPDEVLRRAAELLIAAEARDDDMSPEDEALWRSARTLADLGELTARWIEGAIASQPGYFGAADLESDDLVPVLAAVNRAGFRTDTSQPGELPVLDGG
jgi:hypothetical protein